MSYQRGGGGGDQANPIFQEELVGMGFDASSAAAALIATNNVSVDAALDLLLNPAPQTLQPTYTPPAPAPSPAPAPIPAPKPSSAPSRPPNPKNPINPIPDPKKPTASPAPISKPSDKDKEREKEKEKERQREQERRERERREKEQKEKENAKKSVKSYGDSDEEMDEGDEDEEFDEGDYEEEEEEDDDEDEDVLLEDEALDEISVARPETAVVLDQAQIQENAAKEIERIASITDTSVSTAGALLRAFQWNSEKLLERYYEDPERVMREAGVTTTTTKSGGLRSSANPIKAKATECEICGDDLDSNNSCTLECQHVFCQECLGRYLEVQISDGKSIDITCMAFKCKGRIPDSLIKKLTPTEVFGKYMAFVSKSFVEDNPNIKWCPRPGCGNAVKSDIKSISEAQCSCGFKFCFKCNGEAHAPATCTMMKAWVKKCQDDSETSNWISANTKDCPKCNSAIEKNGGCNHMTCRKCKHEFCWICFGNWSGHSSCNKFVEDSSKSMDRAALERYLHYFHRYNTHEQSKKFEQTLRQSAVTKMVAIQNTDESRWIDVQYIDAATEQLIECRRTLKYTYVFAYYMVNGPEKNLFEYLQAELEKTTEQLSGLLEAQTDNQNPRQIKDVTGLAGKRLQHLREGVDEMLENEAKAPVQPQVAERREEKTTGKKDDKAANGKAEKASVPQLPTPPEPTQHKKTRKTKGLW